MSATLKPCPFCNSSNVAQGASRGRISVWCFCGAQGPSVDFPDDCIDPVTPIRECHAAWNRRADGWQPIYSAPKDGTKIDLWGINHLHHAKKSSRVVDVKWGPVRDWMGTEREDWQHGRGEDFEPTHWMRRPVSPAEAS